MGVKVKARRFKDGLEGVESLIKRFKRDLEKENDCPRGKRTVRIPQTENQKKRRARYLADCRRRKVAAKAEL